MARKTLITAEGKEARMKAALLALFILILAGAAASYWFAASRKVSKKSSVFDVIEDLLREGRLSPEATARIAGKALHVDPRSSNQSFTVFRSDRDVRAALQAVELRIPAQPGSTAGGLVVLSVDTTPCIPPSAVMQRFGTQPEVGVPEPAAPYGFAYRYKYSGRSLSFAFAREKECLMEVAIDATEAQPAAPGSIGSAKMTQDGTIILDLRPEGPGGMIGDARLVYPRGHQQYDEIVKHLGGLWPGESKPVPPWPEKQERSDPNWFGFTPYPGARELCHQWVDGRDSSGPVGIEWRSYAARAATEQVIAFYAKSGDRNAERGDNSITVHQGKDRVLSVHAVSASGYPSCDNKPRPEEKTVIIVSQRSVSR